MGAREGWSGFENKRRRIAGGASNFEDDGERGRRRRGGGDGAGIRVTQRHLLRRRGSQVGEGVVYMVEYEGTCHQQPSHISKHDK